MREFLRTPGGAVVLWLVTMAASHQDAARTSSAPGSTGQSVTVTDVKRVHTLGHDQGNLSHRLANLGTKGLVRMVRTAGGKAEAVDLTPAGRRQVVNKDQSS